MGEGDTGRGLSEEWEALRGSHTRVSSLGKNVKSGRTLCPSACNGLCLQVVLSICALYYHVPQPLQKSGPTAGVYLWI